MAEINYGLSFHIDMKLVRDVKTHFIKTALTARSIEMPILNSFRYEVPESLPHGPKRLGASETLGIFGGVDDLAQRTLSEVIERNIGDALTLALMQFILRNRKILEDGIARRLLVLGPPIPKVIGRFASLRLPKSLGIGWFYCFPPPEWLASFPGWSVVSRAGHHLSRLWMEDELVIEDFEIIEGVEYRIAWMNQYIDYENVYTEDWVKSIVSDLMPTPWVDTSVQLPPVLSLASLYALAERARVIGGYRDSPLDILAAASLDGEPEEDLSSRLEERRKQLQNIVGSKNDKMLFQQANRGDAPLTVDDLKDLVELWNDIKSNKATPIS
jgi:hypothetical protein